MVAACEACASVAPATAKGLESLKLAYGKTCGHLPVAFVPDAVKACAEAKAAINEAVNDYNTLNNHLPSN